MDNVYMEQMVRREGTPMDWVKRIGMILGGLLLTGIGLVFLGSFFAIIFVVVVWMIWILWRRLNREYEYIYTDGHLDVDCVYHRSTRRSMVSIDCREFEVIAPAEDPKYQSLFEKKYNKVLDAGRGGVRENTYIAICNREGNTLKMYFEPNERILTEMKKYIPRKLELRK